MLREIKDKDKVNEELDEETTQPVGHDDLQLIEAYNVMKDLIYFMQLGQSHSIGPQKVRSSL